MITILKYICDIINTFTKFMDDLNIVKFILMQYLAILILRIQQVTVSGLQMRSRHEQFLVMIVNREYFAIHLEVIVTNVESRSLQ